MSEVAQVPQLRFPEFNGAWEGSNIENISTLIQSGLSRLLNDSDIGIPVIRSSNISDNSLNIDDIKYWHLIDPQGANTSNYLLVENDLLINFINSMAQIGKACLYKNLLNRKVIFTTNLMRIQFSDNTIPEFVFYFFCTENYRRQLKAITMPAVNQASFTKKDFNKLQVHLPPKPEQEKIAAFLTTVDNKIEQLSKKQELLKEYKKGLMQQIFSQATRFKADDGCDFPDWEEKNGNEIFDNISNKNHDSDLPILAITQEHGAIPRDLINYKMIVSDKSVSSYKVVETGDFIISLRSFQGGIEYSNYKGICSPAYIILRPAIEIEKKFYKYYLKTYRYIQDLNRKLEGIRDGKMVSYKYFSEIKLPYPSISEQAKIANFLSSIDNKIEQVGKQLRESKQFKKALLQQMFV